MLMFCNNCGNKLEEGNLFCTSCGAKVATDASAAQRPQQNDFVLSSTEEVPVKKKKAPKWVLPTAIVAVLAVIIGVVCWWAPWNSSAHLSGEEHLKKVETDTLGSYVDGLTSVYGAVADLSSGGSVEGGLDATISLRANKDILDLIAYNVMGSGVDLSWLNGITVGLSADVAEDMQKVTMGLLLSNKQIISVAAILNLEDGLCWLGLPELSDTYLELDLDELGVMDQLDEMAAATVMGSTMSVDVDLPDEQVVNELLKKYIEIALENLGEVEKESDSVSLGGLSQDCTVLTCQITQDDLLNAALAVLKEAADDETLMEVIESFIDYYCEVTGYFGAIDIDDLEDAIDDAVDTLEELLDEGDFDDDDYIELVTYVDSKDNVIGWSLEVPGMSEEVSVLMVTEDGEFKYEACLGELEIEGEGTVSKNILDGEFEVYVGGTDLLELEVSDFNQAKYEQGELVGKFVITPSADLVASMVGYSVDGFALALDLNCADSSATVDVAVLMEGTEMVGVTLKYTSRNADRVSEPSRTADMMDEDDLMDWVMDLDFDKLLENMEDAGVPDDYVEILEDVFSEMG